MAKRTKPPSRAAIQKADAKDDLEQNLKTLAFYIVKAVEKSDEDYGKSGSFRQKAVVAVLEKADLWNGPAKEDSTLTGLRGGAPKDDHDNGTKKTVDPELLKAVAKLEEVARSIKRTLQSGPKVSATVELAGMAIGARAFDEVSKLTWTKTGSQEWETEYCKQRVVIRKGYTVIGTAKDGWECVVADTPARQQYPGEDIEGAKERALTLAGIIDLSKKNASKKDIK